MTTALVCEIHTLGYPKAALRAVHGSEKVQNEVSWYYLCLHLAKVYTGMMIAIPAPHWRVFARLDDQAFAATEPVAL